MADNLARFQEIARRGLQDQLDPTSRARFDEAVNRGIITVEGPGLGGIAKGTGEALLTFLTGAVAQPVAGAGGIIEGISSFIRGEEDAAFAGAERVRELSEQLTFQPRSPVGQQILGAAGTALEPLMEAAENIGGIVQRATTGMPGSNVQAALAQAGFELAPGGVGFKRPRTFGQRRQDVAKVEQAAADIGLETGAPIAAQREQIIQSARTQVGDRVVRGQDFEQIQTAVQTAKRVTNEQVNRLYDLARNTKAAVRVEELNRFPAIAREALADFDIEDMSKVKLRLDEFDKIRELPDTASVKMNEIAKFRRRINKNRPPVTDLDQNAALGILKGELDSFIDGQFNADMISGDSRAIQRWKDARGAFAEYKRTFSDNKTIKQLAEQNATPEEIRNWIFGASAIGAKKQAGDVVGRLKGILGEDSTQFASLRQDALFDITEPLLRETPNFKTFANNYDKFVKNNPTLATQLFPDSVSNLDKLRSFAAAVDRGTSKGMKFDLTQALARTIWGHGIAKGAVRVSLGAQAIGLMRRAVGKSPKQRIMADVLGYNPVTPLIPLSPVVIGGVIETGQEDGR